MGELCLYTPLRDFIRLGRGQSQSSRFVNSSLQFSDLIGRSFCRSLRLDVDTVGTARKTFSSSGIPIRSIRDLLSSTSLNVCGINQFLCLPGRPREGAWGPDSRSDTIAKASLPAGLPASRPTAHPKFKLACE
jgi:hypothetical protein